MKKHTFKRLFGYLKAYRLRFFFVLLFACVSTVFTVMAPFVIGQVTTDRKSTRLNSSHM